MAEHICVFGTSTAWGAWDHELGGWVNRLRLDIEKEYEAFIYNCGISGETTQDMLKRLRVEAEARKADVIVIAVGVNDSGKLNGEYWVEPSDFEKNLRVLIDQSSNLAEHILLATPTQINDSKLQPVPWRAELTYDNNDVIRYAEIIKEVGDELGVTVIDNSESLSIEDLDEDGLHPNEKGHEKIYQAVKRVVLDEIPMKKA